jgi:ATP-dependent Clp protease, protease subunit
MDTFPPTLADLVQARLFTQRTISITGVLDENAATDAATALMTLDATGDGVVHLHLDCRSDDLGPAFVLIDTIDLLGVPVHATCIGRVEGPAAGVLAVAHHRLITPNARVRLCEPTLRWSGHAADVEHWSQHHERELARFATRLAEATRQPAEHVEADLRTGRWLDADDALRYGLVDDIRRPVPRAAPDRPRAPFGFQPPRSAQPE